MNSYLIFDRGYIQGFLDLLLKFDEIKYDELRKIWSKIEEIEDDTLRHQEITKFRILLVTWYDQEDKSSSAYYQSHYCKN